jgi:hypothetical protein
MPHEDGTLTAEELASLSPSDRAHYRVKGRLGDGFSGGESDGEKTARAAAFELDNAQGEDGETDTEARFDALEDAKAEAGVTDDEDPTPDEDLATGHEAAGTGRGEEPPGKEEAQEAELRRRSEMSATEKAEAADRDARVRAAEDDGFEVPNVGSPDTPEREDSNTDTVLAPGEKGDSTGPDERTAP